jgi:DNA-binding response OmpR family regulator
MPKILVVDDEKVLVKGIKFNLENEGIRWRWATMGSRPWSWHATAV